MDDILRVLGGTELFVLTLGFWAFTLLFHVLADWKKSMMGRHFMAFMMSCDFILGWAWLGLTFDIPDSIRSWVRVFLYGALAFIVWRQVYILVRMQIIARQTPNPQASTLTTNTGEDPHGYHTPS